MEKIIPFNKPSLVGNELEYIKQAIATGKISGNGIFTEKCQNLFVENYSIGKALLTTSCTDALEMCALLIGATTGDEIIVPSYTFVSTALAFVRQGATVVFADSSTNHPNLDEKKLEELITKNTKAIVVVHYAGVACNMEEIMRIAQKHNLYVIEDAAQALDSFFLEKPLGSIGHLGTFSFHETKNVNSGEGGLLSINDESFYERSEILWEKGTNRSAFFKGEIDKYGWVDTGSSFLPSEITAAFLYAQLQKIDSIQEIRKIIWETYSSKLSGLEAKGLFKMPEIPHYATNNAHMFYLVFNNQKQRDGLIRHLKYNGIHSVFHYLPLHLSQFYTNYLNTNKPIQLPNAEKFSNCLVRLPLYYSLSIENVLYIAETIKNYFK